MEVLLNPGSYLRMGESTTVVLDKVDLNDIALRILQGSAVIEANGFSKELPLRVTAGDLKMEIIKDGIYLFADGKVVVVDGKIRDASNQLVYGKGYQISDDQGYRAQKVKTFTTGLELWSQQRDELIARANLNVANSLRDARNLPIGSLLDVWLWYPAYGSFIYMPGSGYRSPYGYSYYAVDPGYSYNRGPGNSGVNAQNGAVQIGGSTGNSGNSSSGGFSGGGGGGGGVGASQAAAAAAPGNSSGGGAGRAGPSMSVGK
jgi:hypothetical protein